MKKFWYSEGALIFICMMDEFSSFPEILPHWLKVIMPVLGGIAIIIKIKISRPVEIPKENA